MANNIADDNTPYKRLVEQDEGDVPNAVAGGQNLFIDEADGQLKRKDSSGNVTAIGSSSGEDSFFAYLAVILEPLAIESIQKGTYTYAVGGSVTKLALNAWQTHLGSGRWEVRDPRFPVPLRGVTVTGTGSDSTGIFIDPALATYVNARTTYYDRLKTIFETTPLYIPVTAPSTNHILLPGPYGSIITSVTVFDLTWLVARYGTGFGWNLMDEIGDTGASDYQRLAHAAYIPISKNVVSYIGSGAEKSGGVGKGSLTYFNCPSTWGKVTDPNTYIFRDDFMGASLDTTTKWTRTQSAGGNMEIQTTQGVANWCKILGNGSWGANTITSQTSTVRTGGKKLVVDVRPAAESGGNFANIMVGWWDGAGTSYTDLAHALDFTGTAGPTYQLQVFELGVSRGVVGSGYTPGYIYRVRITLDSPGANVAKYEIQGGPEYPAIGGASWQNITPGTTSNSTTPLSAAVVVSTALASYVSDVKVYA